MTTFRAKWNILTGLLLAALLVFSGLSARAAEGPANGTASAEITFVSKDKNDLQFVYLTGLVLATDISGVSYDKVSNTLTLSNVQLGEGDRHFSLTISNMGEDFKLNIVGKNSLDYLSLESIGYDTGCTITGYGSLDIGYLDISNDGSSMVVTVDNTVNLNIDSKKMGFNSLPAVKVSSKEALKEMESMIKILGSTDDQLVYEETPSGTSYAYETTTQKVTVKPSHIVKKGSDGKWGYYVNGKLQTSYTGLAGNAYGLWYIENGYVDFKRTTLEDFNGETYMVVDGHVDYGFNGFASKDETFWFVENSIVQKHYIGPVILGGEQYQIDKGKVS